MRFTRLLPVAGLILAAGAAHALIQSVLEGAKQASPAKIDGKIEPDEYPAGARRTGPFFDNGTGRGLELPAEFWLTYDDKYIYFAMRVEDDPNRVKADEFRQNVSLDSNDHFSVVIDPFGKGSGFSQFRVNANGATQIQVSGGRAEKQEWQGSVLGAGSKTGIGWQAELRIPWAIMDLPSAGKRDLRFNARWYRSQTQRTYQWAFTNNDASKIPVWASVDVPKQTAQRELKLLPFFYGGVDRDGDAIANAGIDFKTSLNQSTQVVGTINPDFRNIENQILSLDFSYFERLASESRPFFQEGAGYRQTGMGSRLFASQRIRQFDTGLNVYGSLDDKTRYGALATADFGNQLAMVASVGRRLGQNADISLSYVGNRQDGLNNDAVRIGAEKQFGTWGAYSSFNYAKDEDRGSGWSNSVGVWQNAAGGQFNFGYDEVTPNFFPRLGFAPERDLRSLNAGYEWLKLHPRGTVMETEIDVSLAAADRFNGDRYRRDARISTSATLRDGTDIDLFYRRNLFLQNNDWQWGFSVERPRRDNSRRWEVGARFGNIRGRDYRSYDLSFLYRPIQRIRLSLGAQWVSHFSEDRQIILGAAWEKGLNEAVAGRLVERGGEINWYLSYRRSGGAGIEWFFIVGDPNAPTFQRQAILKVIVPLGIKY